MTKTGCCPAMLCEASSGRFHAVSKVFFAAREGEEEVTVKGSDEADGGATRKDSHVTRQRRRRRKQRQRRRK